MCLDLLVTLQPPSPSPQMMLSSVKQFVQICLSWISERSDGEINGRKSGRRITKKKFILDFIKGQVHKVINVGAHFQV